MINGDTVIDLLERVGKLESEEIQCKNEVKKVKNVLKLYAQKIEHLELENAKQHQDILELKTRLNDETANSEKQTAHQSPTVLQPETTGDKVLNTGVNTNKINDVNSRLGIRSAQVQFNVAFFSRLGNSADHLGMHQSIIFESVVTNVGGAYDPNTGIFVAPVDGIYVFSTSLTTYTRNDSHYGFVVNKTVITTFRINGQGLLGDSSSQTVVLQLHRGDDISIHHLGTDKGVYGGNHSVFSGFLLSETEESVNVIGK